MCSVIGICGGMLITLRRLGRWISFENCHLVFHSLSGTKPHQIWRPFSYNCFKSAFEIGILKTKTYNWTIKTFIKTACNSITKTNFFLVVATVKLRLCGTWRGGEGGFLFFGVEAIIQILNTMIVWLQWLLSKIKAYVSHQGTWKCRHQFRRTEWPCKKGIWAFTVLTTRRHVDCRESGMERAVGCASC
jgi:hypothetical protein